MSLSSERILKKQSARGSEYFLGEVRREITSNQQRLARQVYNLENRNIKKFAQEWQSFKKKFRSAKEGGTVSKPQAAKNDGKRYDDNQCLELTYGEKFRHRLSECKPLGREDSSLTIMNPTTEGNSSSRNVLFKNRLNDKHSYRVNYVELGKSRERLFGVRQKSNSMIKEERHSLRKRVVTQWDQSPQHDNLSRISTKGLSPTSSTPQYHTEDYIIDITRDKIDRFIRTMHRLDWSFAFFKERPAGSEDSKEYKNHMKRFQYDPDTPINEQAINYMISRRYELLSSYLEDIYEKRYRELTEESCSLARKRLCEEGEYPLLSSLSKQSILVMLQKDLNNRKNNTQISYQKNRVDVQLYFSLPFSEFISYRQTKNSIYQLVGMGAKMGLRMAFSIFDKNRNGLIDEDDLIQMISLSRKLPKLEIDITIISRAMLGKQTKKSGRKNKLQLKIETVESRFREGRDRATTYGNMSEEPSQFSPIRQEQNSQFQDNEQIPGEGLSTSRFSLDKLYTFLKNKEKNKQKDTSRFGKSKVQPLNFLSFCKAYDFKRPFLLYDLFQFIFGTTVEDYKEPIQREINAHLTRLQHSAMAMGERSEEETLQQKWNKRLKHSNAILEAFVRQKERLG